MQDIVLGRTWCGYEWGDVHRIEVGDDQYNVDLGEVDDCLYRGALKDVLFTAAYPGYLADEDVGWIAPTQAGSEHQVTGLNFLVLGDHIQGDIAGKTAAQDGWRGGWRLFYFPVNNSQ